MDAMGWLSAMAAGVALSAVAGLRAFLPLFAAGLGARLGWLPLSDNFAWLGGTPALAVFGLASLVEMLGDKIPAVDHALDVVGTLVRPATGALVVAGLVHGLAPLPQAVVAILVGGGVAGAVHLVKAKSRVGSSLLTMGVGNPVLSAIEDSLAFSGALLAVLLPVVALLFVALAGFLAWRLFGAAARRLGRERQAPAHGDGSAIRHVRVLAPPTS